MKRIYLIVLVTVIIGILIITGCSKNSPPVNGQPTTDGVATTTSGTLTNDAKMDDLLREKLQNHHSIEQVLNVHKNREEWNTTLDRMITYGVKISTDERNQLIDWLIARNN